MELDSGCVFGLVWLLPLCIGTDCPDPKYLNRYVKADIAAKWFDIGVELLDLGVHTAVLDNINCQYVDPGRCAGEMLKLWLQRKPDANWNQLIEALRAPHIKLEKLASEIERMLCKGM